MPANHANRKSPRKATLAIVGAAVLLLLAGGYAYLLRYARQVSWSGRPHTESNLHQIALALMLYTNDDPHGRFPPNLSLLYLQEGLSPAIFVSPSSDGTEASGQRPQDVSRQLEKPGPHESYIYVGAGLTRSSPPDAVAVYDPPARFNTDGSWVLFADGHEEFLKEADVTRIIEMDKSGIRPIYWPPRQLGQP